MKLLEERNASMISTLFQRAMTRGCHLGQEAGTLLFAAQEANQQAGGMLGAGVPLKCEQGLLWNRGSQTGKPGAMQQVIRNLHTIHPP